MLLPDRRCGASLLVSPVFDRLPRVRHGFSTVALGDASGHPAGGFAVDRALGEEAPAWRRHGLRQVHGALVVQAAGPTASTDPPEGDALWTTDRGELLVVRTADCVPVLLAAVGAGGVRAVGLVHAGWRGLLAGVLRATVAAIEEAAPASRVVAALGPSIGACCFEIGPDVAPLLAAIDPSAVQAGTGDRSTADLARIARLQLAGAGVAVPEPEAPPCTRCHAELFPSWRREGAAATRMASFIGIAGAP